MVIALSLVKSPGIHCRGSCWAEAPVWVNMEKRKLLPAPGFEPQSIHPVAGFSTDCAVLVPLSTLHILILISLRHGFSISVTCTTTDMPAIINGYAALIRKQNIKNLNFFTNNLTLDHNYLLILSITGSIIQLIPAVSQSFQFHFF
jgi:hypothetical protein